MGQAGWDARAARRYDADALRAPGRNARRCAYCGVRVTALVGTWDAENGTWREPDAVTVRDAGTGAAVIVHLCHWREAPEALEAWLRQRWQIASKSPAQG